jgi:ubiquinone/menaquinone biosynthesis C-methylase UbiE
MNKTNKDLHFKLMSFEYKIRDFFNPPVKILKELGIKPGYYVLDFGCGPGSFSFSSSGLVGSNGKIYALDINPLAIDRVKKIAAKKGFNNIETILSDCKTNLSDNSIDVILLFDIYHELDSKVQVLEELDRVLKPEGILSVSDHHLTGEKIISEIMEKNLFKLYKENKRIFSFLKAG